MYRFGTPAAALLLLLVAAPVGATAGAPAPRHSDAAEARRPLSADGLLLRGGTPSARASLLLDGVEDRLGPLVLHLDISASAVLDLQASALTVELDGRPVRSGRLAHLLDVEGRATLVMALPDVGPGYHEVALSARLVVADDPCLEDYEREAWLAVDASSGVRWTARRGAPAGPPRVADLPGPWADLGAVDLASPPDTSAAAAAAWLEVDALLRRWGLTPQSATAAALHGSQSVPGAPSPVVPQVVLALHPGGPPVVGPPTPLAQALSASPDAAAAIGWEGGALVLAARHPDGLLDAAVALGQEEFRRRCPRPACLVAPGAADRVVTAQEEPASSRDPILPAARLWTLGERGRPTGWTARGGGTHTLRLVQPVDSRWELARWPELTLWVRASASGQLDPDRSEVTVSVQGRPLTTWSLGQLDPEAEGRLVTRVPEDLWEVGEWVIDIDVSLRGVDGDRCRPADLRALWLTVSPRSSLDAPRDQPAQTGLAAAWTAIGRSGPALVDEAVDTALLRQAAPLLASLRAAGPHPWRVATERSSAPPVRVSSLASARRALHEAGRRADAHVAGVGEAFAGWLADGREHRVPLLPAAGSALLRMTDTPRPRLEVALDHGAPAPAWGGLTTDQALYGGDGWVDVGSSRRTGSVTTSSVPPAGPASVPLPEQGRRLRVLDLLVLSAALLLLLAVGRALFRPRAARAPTPYPDGWLPDPLVDPAIPSRRD